MCHIVSIFILYIFVLLYGFYCLYSRNTVCYSKTRSLLIDHLPLLSRPTLARITQDMAETYRSR